LYGNMPYDDHMQPHPPATARLEARLPGAVHEMLKRAAELQGRTLTDFVITAASEAARKTIEETEILRLSAEDQRRVAEALLKPPSPSAALLRAAERHRNLVSTSSAEE
jgi:uncharacterized protein (DUF1778 family)